MKIYFEQKGGLTGIHKTISINSDSLVPDEASKLLRLIEDANFFDLPSQQSTPSRGADHLNYKVTVEADQQNKKHSIEITDRTTPLRVEPLIRYLRQKAVKNDERNKRLNG
jgi:hypothetical protein